MIRQSYTAPNTRAEMGFSPLSWHLISHVSTKGSAAASALSTVGLAATTLAADTPTRMLFRNPALLVGGLFGLAVMVNPEHRTSIISTRAAEDAIFGRAAFVMVLCASAAGVARFSSRGGMTEVGISPEYLPVLCFSAAFLWVFLTGLFWVSQCSAIAHLFLRRPLLSPPPCRSLCAC